MNIRGLVLIGFSGLCLTAAALTYDAQNSRRVSGSLASITQAMPRPCMSQGIETAQGQVGCFQPVSAAVGLPWLGGKGYRGGAAFGR